MAEVYFNFELFQFFPRLLILISFVNLGRFGAARIGIRQTSNQYENKQVFMQNKVHRALRLRVRLRVR